MHGDLLSYLKHRLRETRPELNYYGIIAEFGTVGMHLGAQVDSMRIMIADNSMGTLHSPGEEFMELFNPASPRWRHEVIAQGLELSRKLAWALEAERPKVAPA